MYTASFFYLAGVNPPNKEFKRDNIILKIRAHKKPSTEKPETIAAARYIMITLITNKNNPKVSIVTGIVRATRMGFNTALRSPNTIATIKAVPNPLTDTPGNTYADMKTATADNNKLSIKLIVVQI